MTITQKPTAAGPATLRWNWSNDVRKILKIEHQQARQHTHAMKKERVMAYDEMLADRIRRAVGPRPDVTEKKMFGGLAFLLDGKMFCGIVKYDLMARVGPARYEAALAEDHARPMDFTGRPMNGYVFVGPGGTSTDAALGKWVEVAAAFVAAMDDAGAAKKATKRGRRSAR